MDVSEILIFFGRPTKPAGWWEGEDIIGGRDEVGGGTWLACSKSGRVAFLTNFRESESNPDAKSRGDLPVRFLKVIMDLIFFSFFYLLVVVTYHLIALESFSCFKVDFDSYGFELLWLILSVFMKRA